MVCGFGHDFDDLLITERSTNRCVGKAADVDVWFHGIDALSHDQPVVDRDSKPFHTSFEVAPEAALRCPLPKSLLVDDTYVSEILGKIAELVGAGPHLVPPQVLRQRDVAFLSSGSRVNSPSRASSVWISSQR